MDKVIIVIASTNGAVFDRAMYVEECRKNISMLISDRHCGAVESAIHHGVPAVVLDSSSGEQFSEALHEYFNGKAVDFFISSYTRVFAGRFLEKYQGRIVNFHPALLPACPGLDGFGDTVRSGCQFIGSTAHFVDEGIDTGKPILQAVAPYDPHASLEHNRHKVYVQLCKMFVQTVDWMAQGRIGPGGVIGGSYLSSEFIPNLESAAALQLRE
ncbi:formyltransferase family protein [Halomonas beimenensis]|uniref:phosphoribosylglycinamide formyltransferase 1 n=1 Tax=Halomonas beimenensis TaxID=475662 RepID=A0A291P8D0_9GAMM|nr:formyltransferase family protein [Halomonas beimenensis]ATJ83145.1 phosphoribosylglycinamide formyltransferase [Halomonas beimenensis]